MMLQGWLVVIMLFSIPKRLFSVQKRHPYTGNLISEKPGDSKKQVSTLWRCLKSLSCRHGQAVHAIVIQK